MARCNLGIMGDGIKDSGTYKYVCRVEDTRILSTSIANQKHSMVLTFITDRIISDTRELNQVIAEKLGMESKRILATVRHLEILP